MNYIFQYIALFQTRWCDNSLALTIIKKRNKSSKFFFSFVHKCDQRKNKVTGGRRQFASNASSRKLLQAPVCRRREPDTGHISHGTKVFLAPTRGVRLHLTYIQTPPEITITEFDDPTEIIIQFCFPLLNNKSNFGIVSNVCYIIRYVSPSQNI